MSRHALILSITLLLFVSSFSATDLPIKIVGKGNIGQLTVKLRGDDLSDAVAGINGTFFCTRTERLANWVVRDGKQLYLFPFWQTRERGAFVVFKDGSFVVGIAKWVSGKVFIENKEIKLEEVKLALAGCSYFLRNGKIASWREMRAEGFSSYILRSTHFSFICINRKNGKVLLGVSKGASLWNVARWALSAGYTDGFRMDGGSAVAVWWRGRKFPHNTVNLVVFVGNKILK